MKKFLALMLALVLALSMCNIAFAESKTIKIGVEIYDPTEAEFLKLKDYFDNYLAPLMNIQFIYSEAIADADGEFAFIDNCASAGCDAIMGYYNVAGVEAAWRAIDNGMYYSYGEQDLYEEMKSEPKYLNGLIYGDNGNWEAGYALGVALREVGCKKVVVGNGAANFGVQMFIDRTQGIYDGLGEGVETIVVAGFPDMGDGFFIPQSNALTTEGVDGIATTYNALDFWVQPAATAGLNVPIATIGAVTDGFVGALADGTIKVLVAANIERYGLQVAMIWQAVNGNKIVDADGFAPMIKQSYITFTDGETANAYNELMKTEHIYSAEELMNMTTYDALIALQDSYTYDAVQARHAGN